MQAFMIWFIAAFALVIAELLSGTLYLLVIGAGAAVAGLIALAGPGFAVQFVAAAIVSLAGIAVVHKLKLGRTRAGAHRRNLSLDAGQTVEVIERRADGSLRVNYRGTQWDAQIEGAEGEHLVIKETRGNTLILVAHS